MDHMKLDSLLIVDDEPLIHEVLTDGLAAHVEEISSCYSLKEALEKVEAQKFDCIILDINLNGQNGGTIFMHIQNDKEQINNQTPIILSSGYIGDDFIDRHRGRFHHILSKPFLADELSAIVKSIALEKRSQTQPPKTAPEPTKVPNDIDGSIMVDSELPFKLEELAPKIKNVMNKVKKNNKLKDLFQQALSGAQSKGLYKTHIGLTINIASNLLKVMGWDSDQTLEKVIYAAYLHDLAIKDRPDLQEFQTGLDFEIKADKLSPEDVELVKKHPQTTYDLLKNFPGIPPDVPEMVLQHHERADGGGFPAKIDHQRITPLATLFIIAHEMAHEVAKSSKFDLKKYISVVTKKHKGPHFRKVTRALGSLA